MIRVLHVVPDLNSGGAELMMKRLIEAHLGDPRYEHRVLSLRGLGTVGPVLLAKGVAVDSLGLTSALRLPGTLWRLTRAIRGIRPDIVQTWMYHADLLGGLAARLAGVRTVLWGVRVADITPDMGVARETFWVRRLCARVSSVIPKAILYVCNSARPPHEALGYDATKGVVIPNGYVLPPERSEAERTELRRRLGLPVEALLVGSAGRWAPQKDFPAFIKAASRVAARFPEAEFVLIGRGVDRDNEELEGLIRDTGIAARFHLLGERRDLIDCLATLDLFSLQSIQEGFPNVVAEAMSAAVPCVVTDVGDAALLVGDTARVIPPRQPDLLAAAMEEALALPPDVRRSRGQEARQRVERHFSIAAVAERFGELYRDLLRS